MQELVAVFGLILIFGVAMWRNINMGAVALVVAFVLGIAYYGQSASEIASGFPGGLLITLLGVTYLFGMARANGTVDRIVSGAVGAVRGRVALVPWVFFVLAAIITGSGALSAATNAILIPVGLAFANRYRINPLLIGLSIINGTNAGGFSPIAVYFSIVDGVLDKIGVSIDAGQLFLWTFIANLLINAVAFFLLGGRELMRRARETDAYRDTLDDLSGGSGSTAMAVETKAKTWALPQVVTVLLMVGVLVGGLGFKLDVGFLALGAAVILSALYPQDSKEGVSHIGWGVILLIGGIVTYISMLDTAGVIDGLANSVAGIGTPLLAGLLMLVVAGVVSAFASTNAMFVVLVPLAAPLLVSGALEPMGFIIALCIAASAVDSSPFSTGGALVVANTEEDLRDKTFKGMMLWGMLMILAAPLLAWFFFVVL
ncbi:SLC13 family permease [Paeniglutamicibacter sp. MACA_103]|uniref:SLC13 family permease n=1 Tax=Paeniglutamicibacter sp. MACA_103 TaxID=3377337 RepID=UPI003892E744